MIPKVKRSSLFRYGVAIASVALALIITRWLWPLIKPNSFSLFFAAVTFSAWYGGLGSGLVATALAALSSSYFFTPFADTSHIGLDDILQLGVFVTVALLISSLSAELRAAKQRAEAIAQRVQRHQEVLQQSEEFNRLLIENVRDYAIIRLDLNGRVASWNAGAERTLGYQEAEIIGQHFSRFFTPEDTEQNIPEQELRTAAYDGRAENERWQVKKGGTRFWASGVTTALQDGNGKLRGFSKVMRDLTDRKQAEEQRTQLLAREQAANRMKDEFLSIVSHELRTPLNAMLGWVRLLRSRNFDETKTAQALETIERNAKAQAQLVEDLLDISRIIRGQMRLQIGPVNLLSVTEAAINSVRLAADAKAIHIESILDPSVKPIAGDPDRLQQVIWNLLSNAIKFTPEGGHVEVRLERHHNHAQLKVKDTGVGIQPEFLPYVFEPFRQADSSTTRSYGGIGLGLTITRYLVELHGGTVHVESPGEGQGATFTVDLPLQTSPIVENNSVTLNPRAKATVLLDNPPLLNGLHILVVEDEAETRDFITTALEQCGVRVTAVASAGEAFERYQQERPDILLSDFGMPGEDGYSLLRRIRAFEGEQGSRIPAVALTAYVSETERRRALAAGFQTHVPKPVDPAELVAVVANLAGRTGSA